MGKQVLEKHPTMEHQSESQMMTQSPIISRRSRCDSRYPPRWCAGEVDCPKLSEQSESRNE